MNKIAIVGHPSARIEEVEALLQRCGMGRPMPSKREGMLPKDIAATLCRAHQCPSLEQIGEGSHIRQIDAGPVWHGLALDLMLGNLDQQFWGWADTQGVFLLDYWRDLDPQIIFVLVYDEPQRALLGTDTGADGGWHSGANHQIEGWHAYNAALLHFYLRHPERTMLVNAQQVKRAADSYLAQLQHKLRAPLSDALELSGAETSPDQQVPAKVQSVLANLSVETGDVSGLFRADGAVEQYLAAEMLHQHPSAMQLYEELQSTASLPSDASPAARASAEDAWQALFDRRSTMVELLARLHVRFQQTQAAHETAMETSARLLENRGRETEELQRQLSHREWQLEQAHRLHADLQNQLATEREHLLKLQATNDGLNLTIHQLREEADQRVQAMAAAQNRLRDEADQLLLQLHQAQEELETTSTAAEKTRRDLQEATASKASLVLELERAKAEMAQAMQALSAQATQPVAGTADESSAQELKHENDLLLVQLHQVQEELERYYLENVQLRAGAVNASARVPSPALTGAGERIKQQLTYRLGARVIQQNRTIIGRIFMLWALRQEANDWRNERRRQPEEKLPKLSDYSDAADAERVKQHLSYRLGQVVMRHGRSPVGWLILPWALRAEASAFRREKKAA